MTDSVTPTQREWGLLKQPVHLLALGFGSGLLPRAPGTWGSLLGLGIFVSVAPLGAFWVWALTIAALLAGVWICGESARRLGVHDDGRIVWDEIAGILLTLALLPRGIVWNALAFLAFRAFDIYKPWPIRDLDRSLPGGLGIMLDDVLAALYAAGLLRIASFAVLLDPG